MASREEGVCPVCKGTKRVDANRPEYAHITYRPVCAGYDKETDTFECNNCGGQYQFCGGPSGRVPLDKDGNPCVHEYDSTNAGRCYTRHECCKCGDVYHIDSSD